MKGISKGGTLVKRIASLLVAVATVAGIVAFTPRASGHADEEASPVASPPLRFRGIYLPMLGRFAWWKVISENCQSIFKLARQGVEAWWESRTRPVAAPATGAGD